MIRLFAGDRIYKILDKLGPVDDEGDEMPLEAKMLTKTVENAQKKVEEQNFLIRKRVLEYDDVMNEQRRVIYKYRREILEGRDISEIARDEIEGVIERLVDEYTAGDAARGMGHGGAGDPAAADLAGRRRGRERWRRRRSTARSSRTPSTTTR